MNKKLIVLIIAASLLPAYAIAAKLNLKQDLGGLDLAVVTEDPDSPDAIKIRTTSARSRRRILAGNMEGFIAATGVLV